MEKGDAVIISLTGKEAASGKVFETTDESIAKEAGIYNENVKYEPTPIVVGNGEVIKGVDEMLENLNVGEEKVEVIEPEKAFGNRNPDAIRIVSLAQFHENKINPIPGLIVNINGTHGKVQTVSGGRVRVDFNHELAGKRVEYRIKVIRKIEKDEEKLNVLAKKYLPIRGEVRTTITDGKAEIEVPGKLPQGVELLKQVLTKTIKESMPQIKDVKFTEIFDVKLEESANPSKAEKAEKVEKVRKKTSSKKPEHKTGKSKKKGKKRK